MKGQILKLEIAGLGCCLYLPPDYGETAERYPVIYVNGEIPVEDIMTRLVNSGVRADFLLLSIQPENWNDDFTPWAASAFRAGEEAPQGRADAYLSKLTEEIKPYMDACYRTKPEPEYTALFGYSLGGLAAVYAVYKTDAFGAAASLSGSLWFDGFCDFMEREKPLRRDLRIYLSLGKKESRSKNPRMGRVADCTARARAILAGQPEAADESGAGRSGRTAAESGNTDTESGRIDAESGKTDAESRQDSQETGMADGERVYFEWNEGGHFHDIEGRFAKAVMWWTSVCGYFRSNGEIRRRNGEHI